MQQLDLDKFKDEASFAHLGRKALARSGDHSVSDIPSQGRPGRDDQELSGKALLVDDEPAILYYTCEMLERLGFEVVEARSSDIALKAFESAGPFDLVLADVTLPRISGPELLQRLRSQQPELQTLLISGLLDPPAGEPGGTPEATPFLAKPFSFDDLRNKLQEMFNKTQDSGPES